MRALNGFGRLVLGTLLAGVLVAALLLPAAVGIGRASNAVADAVDDAQADPLEGQVPLRTTITDSTGATVATLWKQNRVWVPLSSISNYLQVAVVAMEDRRFYSHTGVDWKGTVRALLRNSQTSGTQGGSTLTQQYVKNYLFLVKAKTEAEKADAIATTPIRKLREAKLALQLEQTHTKDEVLEGYLNLVAFGPSQYGAEAASQWFFGTSADKLTLAQAALLAGMVNNPPKYNPLDESHVEDARTRRNLVLDVMASTKAISKEAADEAKQQDLGLNPQRIPNGCVNADNSQVNGYFCQYVLDYLRNAGFDNDTVSSSGWTIKATMDPTVVASAKAAATQQVDPTNPATSRIANTVAVVAKGEPRKVLALVANRPYGLDTGQGQTVQRLPTTFAPLGSGSTFKIFTAAAAMEAGYGTNYTMQTPAQTASPLAQGRLFKNATQYPGSMTMAQALATSPNTGFINLEDTVGLQKVADMSVALGLKGYQLDAGEVDPSFSGTGTDYAAQVVAQKIASFTLGVSPVSPLELSNVGATLASDGKWCPPTPVDTITDRNDRLVTWTSAACEQAVPVELARTLSVAMEGDLQTGGTAASAAQAAGWNWTAAGKTGTTQEYRSSAFIGFTPEMSASVVLWDSEPRPQGICKDPIRTCSTDEALNGNGVGGGGVPATTWMNTMKPLKNGQPNTFFAPPVPQYVNGSASTPVPNVKGKNVDEAKDTLTKAGFVPVTATFPNSGAAKDTVVDQNVSPTAVAGATVVIMVAS